MHVLLHNQDLISICQKYTCRGARIWERYKEVVKGNVKEFERILKEEDTNATRDNKN